MRFVPVEDPSTRLLVLQLLKRGLLPVLEVAIGYADGQAAPGTVFGHVFPSTFTAAGILAAVNAIGTDSKTLHLLPGAWTLDQDVTIPANVHLIVEHGALLTVTAGRTFRAQGSVAIPRQRVFSAASGGVKFDAADVFSEWWGSDAAAETAANNARP